jgi:hypothetical protein
LRPDSETSKSIPWSAWTDDYGFRDAARQAFPLTGVWLSDVPLDAQDGACGDALLLVTLDASEERRSDYEVVEEGKSFRKRCIPAAVIARMIVSVAASDE